MNFTREPIIETVITPKDGYKLTIRNSKGGSQEEYSVDAIEVVSFGQSMFFRSQERPKTFLLPVTDYEVLEVKETRVVLKNPPLEGSIKIGGGKVNKVVKENEEKPAVVGAKPQEEPYDDRPRRRKSSSRRRRGEHESSEGHPHRPVNDIKPPRLVNPAAQQESEKKPAGVITDKSVSGTDQEAPVSSVMFRSLFPPPSGLISEKLQQEKYYHLMKESAANREKQQAASSSEDSSSDKDDDKDEDDGHENEEVIKEVQDQLSEKQEENSEQQESSSEDNANEPRYHAAPIKEDNKPFFHAENNFAY